MKTKTIKTPSVGLTLILSICDKCYGSVIKSTLLCQPHNTRHDHYRGSIPQKEKQEKQLLLLDKMEKRFSLFFLDEKESLKGITVFGERLSACLHTSRLATNGVNALPRVSFSARCF